MRRISPGTACLLAALAGCRPTGPIMAPEPTPSGPPAVQLDARAIDALANLLRMEDRRSADGAVLRRLAGDSLAVVRRRALLAAARVGAPGAADLLGAALEDADPGVRADAAFGLGLLGDTARAVVERLARVAAAPASGEAEEPAIEAAAALGHLSSGAAQAALTLLLDTARVDIADLGDARRVAPGARLTEGVLGAAILATWRVPVPAAVVPALAPYLDHADAEVRWRAAYALYRGGAPGAVAHLLGAVASPDTLVRGFAVRGLNRSAAEAAGKLDEARGAVVPLVADPHPHVRIHAAGALASFGSQAGDAARTALLTAARGETDGNVLVAQAQALGAVGGTAAAAWLRQSAADDGLPLAVRHAALRALMALEPATALEAVRPWLRHPEWLLRYRALDALAAAPPELTVDAYRSLARDADGRVAAAALGRLAATDTTGRDRTLFVEALGHGDPGVRAAALRALSRRRAAADLPMFLDAYARALQDPVPAAALAAVDALAALEAAGIPAARTFFTRFRAAADARVVSRVRERLGGTWATAGLSQEERPHAFYRQVVDSLLVPALLGDRPRVILTVPDGELVLELAAEAAPLAVHNFLTLLEGGYYAGPDLRWHRVVPGFVLQDGDPRGTGSGNPGHAIRDEINRLRYGRGTLGMALSGPDTGGSQYFITHLPQPHLDGGYTVFGRIVEGMEVADAVTQDTPILSLRRAR